MSDAGGDPPIADDPAPFQRRALAHLADLATVGTWLWAMAVTRIAFWLHWSDDRALEPWGRWFLPTLSFVVLYVVYATLFLSRVGATPGHDLLRLRVVKAGTSDKPGLGSALVRSVVLGGVWMFPWLWPGVLLTVALLGSAALDRKGRSFHDHIAGTSVVVRLLPDLEPGQTLEEAEEERRRQFKPRLTNPIQITPRQMLQHPHLQKRPDDDET